VNLLISGGCGFIGSHFVRQALASRDLALTKLVNLDALTYAGNPANLEDIQDSRYHFIHGDIVDTSLVGQLLEYHGITAVIHLAAESHVDRSIEGPAAFIRTNVVGTLSMLEASLAYWKNLSPEGQASFRFLHVSTDEVYGSLEPEDPAFTEETSYQPRSPYAATKASSDHLARSFHHTYGLPVLVTNCSNNYGSHQFPEKLIPLIILNALEKKSLPIYGQGTNIRDWLHVEDHCRALALVLKQGRIGETYNIGGGEEKTNLEIVDHLCDLLNQARPGFDHQTLKCFVADRPGHDLRYAMNSSKIKKELGWVPEERFNSGLQKTVAWYLENVEWCRNITANKYQRARLGTLSPDHSL
jgi:dTDP-glucose 4,6-dehydratase